MTIGTMTSNVPSTFDLVTAGDLVDRLAGLSVDQLRVLSGKLDDTGRLVRALLRERLSIQRRDEQWRARELATAGEQ